MFAGMGQEQPIELTLYTDAYMVHGTIMTRQRRVTDMLNMAEHDFIVLSDVTMDEFGSRGQPAQAAFAQVNLGSVLFAVGHTHLEALPELRTPKVSETALISIPPFKITGRIHVLPDRDLREALAELVGRFVPVTEATYWSDVVNESRTTAAIAAVNHARCQIMAPHQEIDPWAGLDPAPRAVAGADPA